MEMEKRKKVKISHKLPFDVIIDIFSRLPSKSVSRFRCVSKEFLNSIFTSDFYRLHYYRSSQKPFSISMLVLNKSDDPIDYVQRFILAALQSPMTNYDTRAKQQLVLSIANYEGQPIGQFIQEIEVEIKWSKCVCLFPSHHNNLLCIAAASRVYVCSPSRHEFVELPKWSDFKSCSIGFGYVPSKNEYKVVRCFFSKYGNYDIDEVNDCELGCEILTISNYGTKNNYNLMDSFSTWRVLDEGCPHIPSQTPVLVNGSLHWPIDELSEKSIVMEEEILSFNLEEEKFWILPAPQCVRDSFQLIELRNFHLAALREKLWLNHFKEENGLVMDMWVLKDFDKFSWVKEYSIDLSPLANDGWLETYMIRVINITRDEELLIRNDKKQFYFNTETKRFTVLEGPHNMFSFFYYIDV